MTDVTALIRNILADRLRGGIRADRDALHFARSTLGMDSVAEAVLSEDGPALVALILHPDDDARAAVEPIVPPGGLSERDEERVVEGLTEEIRSVEISGEDGGSFILRPEPADLRRYVRRLHMTAPAIPRPEDERSITVPGDTMVRLKAAVRASGFRRTPGREEFIVAVIRSLAGDGRLLRCVEFLCGLFSRCGDDLEAEEVLPARRSGIVRTIDEIRRFEELRARHGMERLLMGRHTPPPANTAALEEEIELIDRITAALAAAGHGMP